MTTYFHHLLLGALISASACSSESKTCEVGSKGCTCYPNRACNSGLSCENDACQEAADLDSGGAGGAGGSGANAAETASSTGGSQNDGGTPGGASGAGGGAAGNTASNSAGGSSTLSSTTASGTSAGGAGSSATNSGGQTSTSDSGSIGGAGGATGSVDAVNLYLMVDAGASMVDNEAGGFARWDIVTAGINDFLSSAELTGRAVNVGIQFFAWISDASCDVSNYSNARVEIGPVAEVSTVIAAELAEQEVVGLTPTGPAFSGAIAYAKDWAAAVPNDHTAAVFLTDGYPTKCEPLDLAALVDLAAASYAEAPSVPVHVIGIDGVSNFDPVAEAGGTIQTVEIVNEGDPAPLTAALVSIATSPFDD